MALATGVFNTNTGNPAELNARSFAGQILRRFPNGSAPMFALTSQSGKSRAKSSTHGYFSKVMTFSTLVVNGAVNGAATTLVVDSTAGVVPGMVFFNPATRENIRVSAVASGTDLTIQRAFGRVAAGAIADDAALISVGTAFEEGSNRPVARRLTVVYVPNYTQIFRNAWALTDTARASLAEAGYNNLAENRADCAMLHAVDIESAIIWGQPKMDTTGPTPIHATQGVIDALEQYAPENTNAAASTTTWAQWVTLVEPAFKYATNIGNPKERVMFVDNQAAKVINDIGIKSGQVMMSNSETKFGMKFTTFQFYLGSIDIVIHPLLNGLNQAGTAIIADMPALKLAYMDGRDTKPEEYNTGGKIVENGVDAVGGSLTTELAVELLNPYSWAYITGLTAAA
ncbi:MAG: DUF5309 family protein [Candidatus Babeliales bacterium]